MSLQPQAAVARGDERVDSTQNSLDSLPDEVLLYIVTFATSDPITVVKLSHINKRMETILNNNSEVIGEMLRYTANDGRIRRGFSIGQFLEHPIRNSISVIKQFFNTLLTPIIGGNTRIPERIGYDAEREFEKKFENLRKYVDSKQRILDCLKYSRLDPIKKIRKIESWSQFERYHMDKVIYGIGTILALTAQVVLGKIGNTPSDQWSLETGLWWLPYSFWVYEGTVLSVVIATLLVSLFYSVKTIRSLIVNPDKKVKEDISVIYTAPLTSLFYSTFYRIGFIFIRSLIYSALGIELSTLESIASKLFYYSHYPGLFFLGVSCFSSSALTFKDKISDPTLGYFISLSLFKYTGNLLSFVPLSLSLCFASIKEIISGITYKDKSEQFIYMALSLSTACISFGNFSYLTLAPVSSVLTWMFVESLKRKKKSL